MNADEAAGALDELDDQWGNRYPGVIRIWRRAWEEFTPFLRFPPQLRKIVYTTNLVESVHYQLRKVTKTRGHFPTDQSALKLLRLAARNITNKRGGNLGTGTHGWKQALNQLEIHFPNRLNLTTPYLSGPLGRGRSVRLARFGGHCEIWDSYPRRSVSCRKRENRIRLSTGRR